MDNTSIAAVTLPNENRHVYFQESTGAFRRAIYSSQAKIWQASADAQVVPDAKNNTPLAGIFDNRVMNVAASALSDKFSGGWIPNPIDSSVIDIATLAVTNAVWLNQSKATISVGALTCAPAPEVSIQLSPFCEHIRPEFNKLVCLSSD
ncbi:MAG: hypothetical protein LQ343_007654 [Gyalolechia ehrenbergii]|nr:MAG: hypothetical protein LQ343_007654 [Gyalolechia ehrenbergii]